MAMIMRAATMTMTLVAMALMARAVQTGGSDLLFRPENSTYRWACLVEGWK